MFSASKTKGAGGFQIANSLRFRSSASAYLNRTPGSAGNRQTWTWSGWVKLGSIGTARSIFSCGADGSNYTAIDWRADNRIQLLSNTAGIIVGSIVWDPYVWRDPSAWYHLVIVCDTTNATQTSRFRFYMNGVQYTGISSTAGENTYPAQNANTNVNNTVAHSLGRKQHNASEYFDGYMADINFIDGQALDPSYFGQISTITGVWSPARYVGSYGTNGFRLNFSNGTSTTTLGNDSSGNGNNWTTNNISLTAGSTYDWMIDSPTPYPGSSYGVGNYCVLNPLATTGMIGITLGGTTSDGNLGWSSSTSATGRTASFYSNPTDNKWYCETYVSALASGTTTLTWGLVANGGANYRYRVPTDTSATAGDILMTAYDPASGKMWYGKNGTWLASGDPAAGTNPVYTLTGSELNGAVFAVAVGTLSSGTTTVANNFGQRPFAYTPPTGFKSLCTQNLPNVSIYNGAQYMAATTYTGTGSSVSIANTVNGVSFQPDFVWIKSRSAATDHALYDVIRGTQNRLESNTTDAAVASDNGLTAFGSSGFTVNTLAQVNTSSATYVAWQWKAGGTAVTNTAGSITSQVSANTTSGFAVVTYTGTGANATVGHGLGVAPSMVICKSRGTAGTNWGVWHTSLTAYSYFVQLNTTAAQATAANAMQALPSSTVLSLGSSSIFNDAATMVAYCFAAIPGYSAFGSYTGNGSTDGPFVYCGFRPRFVLIKWSSGVEYWQITDSSRSPNNEVSLQLAPDQSLAESSLGTPQIDYLSNGFKLRGTSNRNNSSGGTYIYAAFAENPFKYSLAR